MQGQESLTPAHVGSNLIRFTVEWERPGKQHARTMAFKKPPHYLVYQLALDMQAATGIPAQRQLFTLLGRPLPWQTLLGSCGVALHGGVLDMEVADEDVVAWPASLARAQAKMKQLGAGLV
jgi:hypothetical protein